MIPRVAPLPGESGRLIAASPLRAALFWILLIYLLLVPVPLGSNRPFFWAGWAVLVGTLGLSYWIATLRVPGPSPASWGASRPVLLLYLLHCAWILVQLTPLPVHGLNAAWTTISVAPGATMLMLLRAATFGMLFVLVFQVTRRRVRALRFLEVMLGLSAAHAALGLLMLRAGDTLLGMPKWAYFGSATGTFVNRNSFATFLAFGCVLGVALLIESMQRLRREPDPDFVDDSYLLWIRVAVVAAALGVISATLIATQSRMGAVAALIGILVVARIGIARSRLSRPTLAIGGLIALVLATLALLYSGGVIDRIADVDQSWATRGALYQQVAQLIAARPWTGFGGGSFEIVFPLVHAPPVGSERVWDKAHNSYLALWSELGIFGGSLILVALALLGRRLRQAQRSRSVNWLAVAVAQGTLVVGAVHSLADFSLEIEAVAFWFTALLAVGIAQAQSPLAENN